MAEELVNMLIDTHCHLNDENLIGEIDTIIARANEADVDIMICIGYDMPSSRKAVEIAEQYSNVYAAIGIHPDDCIHYSDKIESELESLAQSKKVVAIGEIGLDYYHNMENKILQQNVFRRQIRLAHKMELPISIHSRDASEDTFNIVKEENGAKFGGIMHCYAGHLPMALELIKIGFYISFCGPLTFKNNKKTQEVAKGIPLDRVLVETDCPYLAPAPMRGKRNEPSYVRFTVEKLAELRNEPFEKVSKITTENAKKVFNIL